MIRVLLLSRYDRLGASSRLRFLQYIPGLAERGIEVVPAPFFDDNYLSRRYAGKRPRPDHLARYYAKRLRDLASARDYDLVWLEKEALPWLPAAIELGLLRGKPYVLDFDDAWYERYKAGASAVASFLDSKFETLVRQGAAVLVGNDHLRQWAEAAGAKQVIFLPTSVDLDRYPLPAPRHRNGSFTIGWIGLPSVAPYLHTIAGALREVCKEPGARLRVIGAGPVEIEGVPVEFRRWSEAGEYAELADIDVGISPLSGGPWELGKSGFKIIQYMAVGRPVVASPVGANASIVKGGETGFLAETEGEWAEALTRLRLDHALRERLGRAGRARVEEFYSVQTNVDTLAETLLSASRPAST